jgi:hypothetical protein
MRFFADTAAAVAGGLRSTLALVQPMGCQREVSIVYVVVVTIMAGCGVGGVGVGGGVGGGDVPHSIQLRALCCRPIHSRYYLRKPYFMNV